MKREPNGFHPDRSLPCKICGQQVSGQEAWFDHNGQQCLPCHQAIKVGIIPGTLTPDDFYTDTQLDMYFQLKRKHIDQLIKKRHVIARKTATLRLFLHQDNPNLFPPKDHLKGGALTNPNEALNDYGISKLMRWERGSQ